MISGIYGQTDKTAQNKIGKPAREAPEPSGGCTHAVYRIGLRGTSIRGICDKAGYSQGAFYSNFNNKDEVLLELLEQYKSFEANSRKQLIDDAGGNFEKALNDMILWFERNDHNMSHTILFLEMQLHALRHPTFVKTYNNLMDEQKSFYTKLVQHLFAMRNIEPPFDCSIVAEGLMALGANEAVARRLTH
ncbi:TetR/AcrR family transcriptional regulator [Bartonella sp. W8097]|uniref:TetR/AcrR family transcriptional regulator n=1 Tax=Bartonella apihabitans TaxID=2750929 RepID=UPI0018DE16A2|nr:TetR/AcrR family transcriptional regulator [Bartonella apihabitans]MBI0020015.1 TetR/AcrR family transcriptional regulator [Bartonella apihabitans]